MAELTYDQVSECFKYDPETGSFTWLKRPPEHFSSKRYTNQFNCRFAGDLAFTNFNRGGYLRVRVFNTLVYAHRVAWLLHYGEWPTGVIDHLNGDRSDNRISNLRDGTVSQNMRNQRRRRDNKSGFGGVSWDKEKKKWIAQVSSRGKYVHLGYFADFDDAKAARIAANIGMGFSPRHGS